MSQISSKINQTKDTWQIHICYFFHCLLAQRR